MNEKRNKLMRELKKFEPPAITYIDKDFPIFVESAYESYVYDEDGNEYIDLTGFFGVSLVGHTNQRVVRAIKEQSKKMLHAMGDLYPSPIKILLLKKLSEITNNKLSQSIIMCNGSDAVETSLKVAMCHTRRIGVISFHGSYHGLLAGALSVTSRRDFRDMFTGGFSKRVIFAPYPDPYRPPSFVDGNKVCEFSLQYIRKILKEKASGIIPVGAIIVEPVQGRGGVIVPPSGFLKGLREICDEFNILLILDEIFTGFGRTGKFFAYEYENIIPDLLCIGKAMGGGFPISACLGKKQIMKSLGVSKGEAIHTSTFLGNPLGCAASLAVIEEIEKNKLVENAQEKGSFFINELLKMMENFHFIGDVRGKGLIIGVEIVKNKKTKEPDGEKTMKIVKGALKKGVLILPSGQYNNVLSFTPPLTISKKLLSKSLDILNDVFKN